MQRVYAHSWNLKWKCRKIWKVLNGKNFIRWPTPWASSPEAWAPGKKERSTTMTRIQYSTCTVYWLVSASDARQQMEFIVLFNQRQYMVVNLLKCRYFWNKKIKLHLSILFILFQIQDCYIHMKRMNIIFSLW
jgi:hypothetical protein